MREKVRLREKIAYGVGAMANEFQMMVIGTYLLLFFTDVMKLPPASVGGIFLVGGLADAVSDIIIINIADKGRTPWGTYRPWILAGIPLAVCFVLNFWYPSFLKADVQKLVWVYAVYLLTVPVFQTCFICPYVTMNSVMSKDGVTRLDFATCRSIFENIADLLVNALVMTIVLYFGRSYKDIFGWRIMALGFAALMVICSLIGFTGTRERIEVSDLTSEGYRLTLWDKIKLYRRNPAAWKMLGLTCFFYFFWVVISQLFSFYCINYLRHPEWVAPLSTLGVAAQLGAILLLPFLGRRFQKRSMVTAGCILLLGAFLYSLFIDGFLSAAVYQVVKGIGCGLINSLIWSMWPEVVDYTERLKGIAAPGVITAVGTFMMKIGTAVAGYFVSWILLISGYNAALNEQPFSVCQWIRYSFVVIPFVCILVTMIINFRLTELKQ